MNQSSKTIYGELNQISHWYAVSTRSRHEKKLYNDLIQKGIVTFLPLQKFQRKWSDRYKIVEEPLFSCYVFVKIPLTDRLRVLQTGGAVKLISFNGIPAVIPAYQIEAIKIIMDKQLQIEKVDYLIPGQTVEVIQGPLKGITGILAQVKNSQRLVIRLDSIMQAFSIDVDYRDIKILDNEMS